MQSVDHGSWKKLAAVNSRVDKVYDGKEYFLGNSISQLLMVSNMIDGEQETGDLHLQELRKA